MKISYTFCPCFLLITILYSILVGCSPSNAQDGFIHRIENQELKKLQMTTALQLVDVRTAGEFERGYIEGARLIDFTKADFSEKVGKLDRTKPIAVYCAVGGRSYQSTAVLKRLGFQEIYDLKGGIQGWKKEGLPLKK
ncbi:MAG: rhodanese-like domain-containing protein [Cyclobacteriaceae bacterium]|jgi:rhodanese-related sulfurtransferase